MDIFTPDKAATMNPLEIQLRYANTIKRYKMTGRGETLATQASQEQVQQVIQPFHAHITVHHEYQSQQSRAVEADQQAVRHIATSPVYPRYELGFPSPAAANRRRIVVEEPGTPCRRPNAGPRQRVIVVNNQKIEFVPGTVLYPKGRKSYGHNIEGLVQDWDIGCSSLVQIRGIPVPIRCWSRIFRNSTEEDRQFWETYKKHWSEQNVSYARTLRESVELITV